MHGNYYVISHTCQLLRIEMRDREKVKGFFPLRSRANAGRGGGGGMFWAIYFGLKPYLFFLSKNASNDVFMHTHLQAWITRIYLFCSFTTTFKHSGSEQ